MNLSQADCASRKARVKSWQDVGTLSTRAIAALALAGCDNTDDIRRIGKAAFRDIANCGEKTLREIGAFVGGWAGDTIANPEGIIQAAVPPSLPIVERTRIAATIADALLRNGYHIVARKTE